MSWRGKFKWSKKVEAVSEDIKILKAYYNGKDPLSCARSWNKNYDCNLTINEFEKMACDLGYRREEDCNDDYREG